MQPKYPEIRVQLVGQDGNAFAVIDLVQRALRRADVPARSSSSSPRRPRTTEKRASRRAPYPTPASGAGPTFTGAHTGLGL